MALGQNNNDYQTFTSRCNQALFSNGNLNFTCLKFEYWNGLLAIRITPCITNSESKVKVDNDNTVSIFLTPQKCRILLSCIETMQKEPNKFKNAGINSSNGLITFSYGEDYGLVNSPMLSIRKISEHGEILSSLTYEFNKSSEAIVNFFDDNPTNNKEDLGINIEIDLIKDVLRTFIEGSTAAYAYWNEFTFDYVNQRRNVLLNSIADKLGVERNGTKKTPNKSYFNNNNDQQTTSQHQNVSVNSLEDMV